MAWQLLPSRHSRSFICFVVWCRLSGVQKTATASVTDARELSTRCRFFDVARGEARARDATHITGKMSGDASFPRMRFSQWKGLGLGFAVARFFAPFLVALEGGRWIA